MDPAPKSIFSPKGGGKLSSGSDFGCSEKLSYFMMTFTKFLRDSESE
mgnify:CR=1 FL=1